MEWSGSTIPLAAVVAAVVVVVTWVSKKANEWWYLPSPSAIPPGCKLPPGSLGWPVIGDMLSFVGLFRRDPEAYFRKAFLSRYKGENKGIYKAHLFGVPCIITCSAEMNKFVLGPQAEGTAFTAGWPSPNLLGADCMGIVEGVQHKRMRKLLAEAISQPSALKKALLRLEKRFTSTLAEWAEEKNINLRAKLKDVTFDDICDAFFSKSSDPLVKKMASFTQGLIGGLRAYPINIPGFSYHKALQCRKSLTDIMFSIIEHRRRAGSKAEEDDFLDVLVKTQDEQGNYLTNSEITDNIIASLLAGHESTSYTILWTMVLLAKNPLVWSKLRNEHLLLQSQTDGIWSGDFKQTPYTNLVLNEVLRLLNVSPFVFRTVEQEGVNYQGYYFPKGWKVVAWLRASHMNPTYFVDPHNFNPDRFLAQPPRSGQYMPFGYGPRVCPGNMLALLSSRLFIHILVTKYKWKLVNPNAKVTYLPHPKPIDGGDIVFEPL
ncbi:hypothetical protein GOP47_0007026 [Adiantum capillus-veneris]|uniref:Cytochrome P450 n=1 Tax=Adiantum capillus-veneris TaxID=13818 RepID=A0A9D4V1C6_ADICA|nr:hypothetical protein GOP47_0007026 [Adiantum capillus-veneris]